MRPLAVARSARRRLKLGPPLLDPSGTLDAGDALAARRIADRLTRDRPTSAAGGEVLGLAALNAVLHRVVEDRIADGSVSVDDLPERAAGAVGEPALADVGRAWNAEFGGVRAPSRRADEAAGDAPRSQTLLDLVVLGILNENPATIAVRDLVDDRPLRSGTPYEAVVASIEQALGAPPRATSTSAAVGERGGGRRRRATGRPPSLPEELRRPFVEAQPSLEAQLKWIRDHWRDLLAADPALAERVALAIDVVAEERRAWELHDAGPTGHFGGPVTAQGPDFRGLDAEPEAFSSDTDWMPSVVLVAKSSQVWLEQLGRTYGAPVKTLADVPDAELERLAHLGVTGLWLIGLWQRSRASAEIKRRRGDTDAVASAYSIDEYRIADDLGGEAAFEDLKARAAAHGIRMAADMVPNHMGLDSRWVIEHPERFLSVAEPPFPAYRFSGPDLSPDPGVEIRIEDHYWDATDAAVVFSRHDRGTGETRYLYHGNDGTSFPWNDTAQLDYLRPDVREAVIRTILDVARRAPILRFDAAMVLARRHIQRLWYPEPGSGGAIPSRAEHAMRPADFDRAMPREFWREVVDRVAAEAPGTLLLAEAFWLLEGYFVRTLGMHRVYNSAFMHMLRDEDNAGYRRVMRDTLEFQPGVLQRFVNFMTNPDERPAAEQFGTGEKAFAIATLLATLPGLPMLGHGQIEGFRERYGMEFRRARWDEPVDEPHVGHFERTIAPLLRRRADFAGTSRFRLYDAIDRDGSLVEDVFAFSNGYGDRRSLVLVHNRFGEVDVRIDRSVQFRSGDRLQSTRLGEDLELPADGGLRVQFADPRSGWRVEASVDELRRDGLHLRLGPYEARVLDVSIVAAEPDAVAAAAREPRMGAPSTAQSAANGAAGRPARRTRRPTKSVTSATDRPAQSPKSRRRRSGNGRSP